MRIKNLQTGEIFEAHRLGTYDDEGYEVPLYLAVDGWEPLDPYSCVEDGNWIARPATRPRYRKDDTK